ncbi:MAG TPA: protein kinase [Vicinamibacterales bacterium]|nr:protein kinase [Vicinamibacterales bacterium]
MALSPGTRLGPYEIVAPLGAGGMGEIYRARDTQLEREVAVKVLPPAFASDPERLARFDREAKVLAALNHPNIAIVHGLVESGGQRALVMELVPGETLASMIARGPLAAKEVYKIARQIAEALEAAHDRGVVHRDLKPGNVMVSPAGLVKVLDFGLAAMVQTAPAASGDLSNSPTLTVAGTFAGTILGTASYMSPEQAEGLPVDKRADIWSYGVVLWEMLTGKRLFEGPSLSRTLADVLRMPIEFTKLPAATPKPIRTLLERCLDRETKTRLRDIGEARIVLDRVIAGVAPEERLPRPVGPAPKWTPWAVAVLALAVAAAAGWSRWSAERPLDRPLTRLSVDLGPDAVRGPRITAVLSPDGTRLVFTGRGTVLPRQLFTRRLDQAVATPLAGTEVGGTLSTPFFSPDGEWIGFLAAGVVRKVAVQGGSAVTIGESPGLMGASWGDDGNIILGSTAGLIRLPSAGGAAQPLKAKAGLEIFPQVLLGARAVLFNAAPSSVTSLEDLSIDVLVFETGETKTLLNGGYWPRYLPTSGTTGDLLYMHEGTLFGVAFDPARLEIRGTPVPLLDDVAASTTANSGADGGGQFAFSQTGTFIYLSGTVENAAYPMMWLDAAGKTTPFVARAGTYEVPRLSPDGTRLAYTATESKGTDVWVYDVGRDTPTQLTFTGSVAGELAWAPDSKHVVFRDASALWWIRADGSGDPLKLLDIVVTTRPWSFCAGWTAGVHAIATGIAGHSHPPGGPERPGAAQARQGRAPSG